MADDQNNLNQSLKQQQDKEENWRQRLAEFKKQSQDYQKQAQVDDAEHRLHPTT